MVSPENTLATEDVENCKMQISKCKLRVAASVQFAICNLQSLLCALCILCGNFLATARASTAQQVVPLEGEPFLGELVSFGTDGRVVFRVQGPAGAAQSEQRAFHFDELVRWGHPREPRPQILVVLTDGGRLVAAAAWSGGAPVRMENDHIAVLTDAWGELRIPRSKVRGLVLAEQNHPRQRDELEEVVRESVTAPAEAGLTAAANGDLVLLTNKDRVTGKVTALSGGSMTFETAGGSVKVPLSRVEAVVFRRENPGSSSSARRSSPRFVIGTRDGSIVFASAISAGEDRLDIEVADRVMLSGTNLNDIALLQSLGGRFDYLSDLEPDGYRHVPYLSIEWPHKRDHNVLGDPLSVGGKRYLKGIGMHSAARLTYQFDSGYRRFDAAVAIDDSAGKRGSVTFGVYVLREGRWTEAFKRGTVRGGEVPQPVSADVTGAQGITLTVDYADRGEELDRANWLDARLVK
jgi:hypothetical protein